MNGCSFNCSKFHIRSHMDYCKDLILEQLSIVWIFNAKKEKRNLNLNPMKFLMVLKQFE